jgi:acyl-coenzyme A synthetase/AMP-(fatty) acid ligase
LIIIDCEASEPDPCAQRVVLNPWENVDSIHPPSDVSAHPQSRDLAAVLYTSGSTGPPKGVEITHSAILTFIEWGKDYFGYTKDDRCISHAPLHFDLSLLDVFVSHAAGATCVLVPDRISGNPMALSRLVADEKITIWQSVPSILALMIKYGDMGEVDLGSVRHVCFAGETLRVSMFRELATHFYNAAMHNIYGATETNDSFIFSVDNLDMIKGMDGGSDLPIGRPLPYVEYRIVSSEGAVADAMAGELYVRSPTMMHGYRNQQPIEQGSFYRTKDLVKVRNDGSVQFCGRTDDIIKSSGYRVNLLEVENTLQAHADIVEVAVVAERDDDLIYRIVAVICVKQGVDLVSIDLRNFCAEVLPRYAIPHVFEIGKERLPKTPSGKIDKRSIIDSRR